MSSKFPPKIRKYIHLDSHRKLLYYENKHKREIYNELPPKRFRFDHMSSLRYFDDSHNKKSMVLICLAISLFELDENILCILKDISENISHVMDHHINFFLYGSLNNVRPCFKDLPTLNGLYEKKFGYPLLKLEEDFKLKTMVIGKYITDHQNEDCKFQNLIIFDNFKLFVYFRYILYKFCKDAQEMRHFFRNEKEDHLFNIIDDMNFLYLSDDDILEIFSLYRIGVSYKSFTLRFLEIINKEDICNVKSIYDNMNKSCAHCKVSINKTIIVDESSIFDDVIHYFSQK